jgi:hypothetical protein
MPIVHAPLSSGQAVRNVEVCSNIQCLGDHEAKAESNELLRGTPHNFLSKQPEASF